MQEEHWSTIIESRSSFSLHSLAETWNYRDLLLMFVKRDTVTNYKQTILGPLWFFIQPALTTALFVFINKAAHIPTNGIHPVLFYLIGITAWNYFSECLLKTSTTFKENAFIFGKVYFPRLILPLSIVVSSLIKFFIQLILFLIVLFYLLATDQTTLHIGTSMFYLPLLIVLMAGLGLGSGLIITSLTTKYRDLALLVQFGIQLLMYATLVIPASSAKGYLHTILLCNPMVPVIEAMRFMFFGAGDFKIEYLAYSVGCMLVLLLFGVYIFSKTEKSFTDTV